MSRTEGGYSEKEALVQPLFVGTAAGADRQPERPGRARRKPDPGATGASPLLGTGFTYQGQLKDGGTPVDGPCDLQFSLWDALSGEAKIGSTLDRTAGVAGGLFTVQLDFGSAAFTGDSRWLEIAVRCPAGGATISRSTRANR